MRKMIVRHASDVAGGHIDENLEFEMGVQDLKGDKM
jgi:hypothetical protein